MKFVDRVVRRGPRTWPALSVVPVTTSRLGTQRLHDLRAGHPGGLDHAILNAVESRHGDVRLVIFRGRDDSGEYSWGFDPQLDSQHDEELGYHLVRTQLPTYRALVKQGVALLAHIELGTREVEAFERGTRRLLEEVIAERETGRGGPDVDRDVWILGNLTSFFEGEVEEVVEDVLPRALARLDARSRRMQTLTGDCSTYSAVQVPSASSSMSVPSQPSPGSSAHS